jgi:type VI secretion system secreted protein VgrG
MVADYVEARLEASDFPCEHVQIWKLSGREAISELFSFEIEIAVLDKGELDLEKVAGAEVSLVYSYQPSGREIRRIHGMISAVSASLATEASHRGYRLTMVPRAYRLTLAEAQRIFLDKSIPEILKDRLPDMDVDFEFRLERSYPAREFVVQYRETDLAFISRLTEHVGIFFFFEHDGGRDKMIFTDHNKGCRPIEGDKHVHFRPKGEARDVFSLDLNVRLVPALYTMMDYNHQTPRLDLTADHELEGGYTGGVIEYGAHHLTPEEGKALAQVRAEERGATRRTYTGQSDNCNFGAGAVWELEGHPRIGQKEMLLTEVEHRVEQTVMMHGGGQQSERPYVNTFRSIELDVPYRPPRRTPKPKIFGVVFGLVEPEKSGEIGQYAQIDQAGSYTVRFLFDTSAEGSRTVSSLPIRMLQPHAGPNYGMHFPLKPGIEVMVAFVEGDPDRPFIVGAVPNPITPSPVVRSNAILNRIESATGILIEMKDV